MALYHTYFACFRCGIREQLVKAGLIYIAMDLGMVDGWNIVSKNVEDVFGIPIKMLRKLNSYKSVETVLSTDVGRDF